MMKTAIITGASRGIGHAAAKKFLAEGWFVVGTSTSGKVNLESPNFKCFQLDYLNSETVLQAAEKISELDQEVFVLINNAGIGIEEPDSKLEINILRQTLEVNLIGLANFTNRIIPLMQAGGHIINISSAAGSLDDPINASFMLPAYKISKAALNMYTRVMARQLESDKIAVSSMDPGWVKTRMGGLGATRNPEEAAEDVYNLAISKVESGQFWLRGKKRSW